ncbi:MAG: hypothetical protein AB2813_02785, partial [Candidatus Sedimenticola endophacoides]
IPAWGKDYFLLRIIICGSRGWRQRHWLNQVGPASQPQFFQCCNLVSVFLSQLPVVLHSHACLVCVRAAIVGGNWLTLTAMESEAKAVSDCYNVNASSFLPCIHGGDWLLCLGLGTVAEDMGLWK